MWNRHRRLEYPRDPHKTKMENKTVLDDEDQMAPRVWKREEGLQSRTRH